MKTLKLLSAVGVVALILSGCKGDTGPTGPAGAAGANGVANISSTIYTVAPGAWTPVSGGYVVVESDAAISNANADGIEVFVSENANGPWVGTPLSDALTSNGDVVLFSYTNNQMQFGYLYTSAPTVTLYFKVVVIPPAIMKKYPATNWHDYAQVNAVIQTEATFKN